MTPASEAPRDPPGRWLGLLAAFVCCFGADARARDRFAVRPGADAAMHWNPTIARAESQSETKRIVMPNAARSPMCGGPTVLAYRRRDPVDEHGVKRLRNSRKVTQLTADADRSAYGILGTDLGISLELDHRMFFFFGDTEAKGAIRQTDIRWPDSIGYTDADIDPEHTALGMKWITGEDPSTASPFKPVTIHGDYRPNALPEEKYGGMVVPTGVFASPVNHDVYLFYSSIEPGCYSVIAKASSFGAADFTFDYVTTFSVDKFVEVSPVVVTTPETGVYAFGTSKDYRQSKVLPRIRCHRRRREALAVSDARRSRRIAAMGRHRSRRGRRVRARRRGRGGRRGALGRLRRGVGSLAHDLPRQPEASAA